MRSLLPLLLYALAAGCTPKAVEISVVPCVFLKNHTGQPVAFDVTVNGALERIALSPGHGIFFYEAVDPAKKPIHASIECFNGTKMNGSGTAVEICANTTTQGEITAQGWAGASMYSVPTQEWLAENKLSARRVTSVDGIHAVILAANEG